MDSFKGEKEKLSHVFSRCDSSFQSKCVGTFLLNHLGTICVQCNTDTKCSLKEVLFFLTVSVVTWNCPDGVFEVLPLVC